MSVPTSNITRRRFLAAAGAAGLGTGTGTLSRLAAETAPATHSPAPEQRRPNILMLMSDEHHPTWTSVHGHAVHTPNMQRLAALGTVFDNTYCPSPLCSPSRSAFLSGMRPHELQWYSNCNVFPQDHPTYGSVLAKQGIHTVLMGKTDVFEQAGKLGFSEMIRPEDRGFPGDAEIRRNPLALRIGAEGRAKGFGPHENPFNLDLGVTDSAVQWLEKSSVGLNQAWTLSVELLKPHFPHFVTPELWNQYADGADLPRYGGNEPSANHPRARDLRDHFQTDKFTEAQVRGLRRGYLGCVTFVDQQLGRLLDALERTNQLDNTIVVYTSDHGDMLGKFGMWWKCSLYDDSARVPMIVAGPGFAKGARVRTPVTLYDLQASFFHALGAKRPAEWSGSPLQQVAANDPARVVFSEYHGHGTRASSFLVRRGDAKLIYHVDAPVQLFDLADDPEELRNVAGSKPTLVQELTQELHKFCDPELENRRAEEMIERQLTAMAAMPKGKGADV